MRNILTLSLLALAAASQAAAITLTSYSYVAGYSPSENGYYVDVFGTVDNTAGARDILGFGALSRQNAQFSPGALARFNPTNYSAGVPVGESFTGKLARVGFAGPGAASGFFAITSVDSDLDTFISPTATLQTVPEPASIAALGLGVAFLFRRRRIA